MDFPQVNLITKIVMFVCMHACKKKKKQKKKTTLKQQKWRIIVRSLWEQLKTFKMFL